MTAEKPQTPIQRFVPKPIQKLLGGMVEIVEDAVSSRHHLASMKSHEEQARLHEQRTLAHVIGMTACNALKHDEPAEDHLLALKIAVEELPADVNIWNLGFDEEQLALLGQHFGPPPDEVK